MNNNLLSTLETLSSKDWENLFVQMEVSSKNEVDSNGDIQYRYLGEIDAPEEMLFLFAPLSQVKNCGKTNWFICSDGTFYTCGDSGTDYIWENKECVECDFPFEEERQELYDGMSLEQKVVYRIKLQGISKQTAIDIVKAEENGYDIDMIL